MTRRLFVCHANADIEATSEVIDALENALNFRSGSLWTSSMPGYSSELDDVTALRGALAGSDMVLAVVTDASVHDPHFLFQLGAAWALGAHTVLFLLDPAAQVLLPFQLTHAPVVYAQQPEQWSRLIGDLSVRLGLAPRPASSTTPSIAPTAPGANPSRSASQQRGVEASEAAESTVTLPPSAADSAAVGEHRPSAAPPMPHNYLDELRAIGGAPPTTPPNLVDDAKVVDRAPPRHSYIEDLRTGEEVPVEPEALLKDHVGLDDPDLNDPEEPLTGELPRVPEAAEPLDDDDDDDDDDVQTLDSDVFARLPTCEMALEAGRAVSDCVFNRAEISDFSAELDEPLGRLVESLGASWVELRNEQDLDTWVAVTDQLLLTLPDEVRKMALMLSWSSGFCSRRSRPDSISASCSRLS